MYLVTIITPFFFLLGAMALYIRLRNISSIILVIGFFLVTLSALLPFFFPVENDMTISAWQKIQMLSYIGSIGSIISAVSFLWFSVVESRRYLK